jgi:glutathione S-transferase
VPARPRRAPPNPAAASAKAPSVEWPPSLNSKTDKRAFMKLIGSNSSPYVRKVRIVMAEKKLDYEFVQEDVWAGDTSIGQSNPLGKVPCLVMEGGEALFDSRVIVEYLDTLSPVGKLIPAVGRERAEVKTWEALADGVMDAAILGRLERTWAGRKDGERSQAWIDRQLAKVNASVKAMSQGLGEKPYCAGIYLSLADIAVGCALAYLDFRFREIDWRATYPNLAKLQEKLNQRQSFLETKPV